MKKYFYERSKFSEFKSNATYHQLLQMTDDEFVDWARLVRKEITELWDESGTPPVIGRNYKGIVSSLKKLKNNSCDFLKKDFNNDAESLGLIQNFNKDASVINQFFPTMLKTKITAGKTADGGLSIYDYFADPSMEDRFVHIMKRAVKRDSMYSWARSVVNKKPENPFWDGHSAIEFVEAVYKGKIFTGKFSDYAITIAKGKESTIGNYGTVTDSYVGFKTLYLTTEEINKCIANGWLDSTQLSNISKIEESSVSKTGKVTNYVYFIRWYDKNISIFPDILRVFRLSCGQPAVNFPALTAKYLYEKYTSHITQDEPITIYDPSAGWGGRIIGAMSTRKHVHYVGTDPNPDNFIAELGISRYDYLADFYNKNCVDDFSESFSKFFQVTRKTNTFETFTDGSELISNNPKFQKYKGKLDLVFTSPPYFNREQYSQDETQSFKAYGEYPDWRDNFLKPTLKTAFEYLKENRYIIWNIASIKVGTDTYFELEEDSIKILKELGCEYKGKLKMLMTRMVGLDSSSDGVKNKVKHNGKYYKYEPIFVFYKPKK